MRKGVIFTVFIIIISGCAFRGNLDNGELEDFIRVDLLEEVANVFDLDSNFLTYQNYQGDVVKVDLSNNRSKWKYNYGSNYPAISFLRGDSLLFISDFGGDPIFTVDNDGKIIGTMTSELLLHTGKILVQGEDVFAESIFGILKFNSKTGKLNWKKKCLTSSTVCNIFMSEDEQNIYAGGMGDSVHIDYDNITCIEKSTGSNKWNYSFKGVAKTDLAVNDKYIFVGIDNPFGNNISYSDNDYIICLDKHTGALVWKERYNFSHSSSFILKSSSLLFENVGEIVSINTIDGKLN